MSITMEVLLELKPLHLVVERVTREGLVKIESGMVGEKPDGSEESKRHVKLMRASGSFKKRDGQEV